MVSVSLLTNTAFRLMTITQEPRLVSEGLGYTNASMYAHVCAFGSVEFVSNKVLTSSAFGNGDVLLSLFRTLGKEVVPVGLDFKVLYDDVIEEDYLESGNPVMSTVLLIAVPAVAITIAGSVVLMKRKFRK